MYSHTLLGFKKPVQAQTNHEDPSTFIDMLNINARPEPDTLVKVMGAYKRHHADCKVFI
jgi:hypothetical protein